GREHGMRLILPITASSLALLAMTGCAAMNTTMDSVKDTATRVAQAAKAHAEAVYQRQQHYLAEHDVLKTFEDASEHSEAEVLRVLHAARAQTSTAAGASAASSVNAKAARSGATRPAPMVGSGSAPSSAAPNPDNIRWPVEAGVISSDYATRWGEMRKGTGIAADRDEPVFAVAEGDVIYAGDGLRGYGNV